MNKDEITNIIKELVEKTTVGVTEISITEEDKATHGGKEDKNLEKSGSKITWVGVEVREPHFFLDRGGEALSALNHLARKIIEAKISPTQGVGGYSDLGIMIDINGFQKKRIENIRAVAHMMAERARYFKSNIEIDPMTAFERLIVHEFLSSALDLKTESVGTGPSRRVVIKYIGVI